MYKIKLFLTLLFIALYTIEAKDRNKKPYRIVCYVGTWANYHTVEPFYIENIDVEHCTHVMYGFAKINDSDCGEMVAFDSWLDLPLTEGGGLDAFHRFNKLRQKNPELTTLLALGGWNERSEKYSHMAADPILRKRFIESAVKLLKHYDFDGLDLDWEYPTNKDRGGDPIHDKDNYLTLITELRAAFTPHELVLTAAVSANNQTVHDAYYIPKMNELLDFYSIMAYDYHGGSWEDYLGHNAPMYPRPEETGNGLVFNINYTVNYWLSHGADPKKMVLGMPLYGRTYKLNNKDQHYFGDKLECMEPKELNYSIVTKCGVLKVPNGGDPVYCGGPKGLSTRTGGFYGYNEICKFLHDEKSKWTVKCDKYYQAMYMYSKDVFISFDNEMSLGIKASFMKKMGLSGAMVWSLDDDDFLGYCGSGKYPLTKKVYEMLNGKDKDKYETIPDTCEYEIRPTPPPPTTRPTTIPTTKPTTQPTTKPTTQSTPKPTTQPTTVTRPRVTPPQTTKGPGIDIPGFGWFNCPGAGMWKHPLNMYRYIVCEHVPEGWRVTVMDCAPGTRWDDEAKPKRCKDDTKRR